MIKKLLLKSAFVRRQLHKHASQTLQPQWEPILDSHREAWNDALAQSSVGDEILVATSVGSHLHVAVVESLLSVALTLRGAQIHVFLCDGVLPACLACWHELYPNHKKFVKTGPRYECKACFEPSHKMFTSLGVKVHRYSDYISNEDARWVDEISKSISCEDIENYRWNGMAVGEHALAGALRFLARGTLEGEPFGEAILRRYFSASLLSSIAIYNLIKSRSFKTAVFHHGIYVPQGLIGEACRKNNIHVVNWFVAYRKGCFIFSHDNTYHHTMMTEPVENWKSMPWTDEKEKRLLDYLRSRWEGTQDWIWFHKEPSFRLQEISAETGIDFERPIIGLLTSVMWDAVLHYPSNAFTNMIEWVNCTIEYFCRRPDVQLVIRIHPAEVRGTLPSRQKLADEIKKRFPDLPKNIIVIPPESHVSTYAVMMQCDSVIIYNTKTGVELSAVGIPVIVAGEAWIRNKGFAIDVKDKHQYIEIMDRLPLKKKNNNIIDAKKYAYHFFFRRMIPVSYIIKGTKAPLDLNVNNVNELNIGSDPGLDTICNGILRHGNFYSGD